MPTDGRRACDLLYKITPAQRRLLMCMAPSWCDRAGEAVVLHCWWWVSAGREARSSRWDDSACPYTFAPGAATISALAERGYLNPTGSPKRGVTTYLLSTDGVRAAKAISNAD